MTNLVACRALDADGELCNRPCAAGEFLCAEHIAERDELGDIVYLPTMTHGEIIGEDFYASDECIEDTGFDPRHPDCVCKRTR